MSEMTLLDKAAEAVAIAEGWDGFHSSKSFLDTPSGNDPEDERQRCRDLALSVARVILSAPASEGMRNASVDAELRDDWSTAGLWSAMSSALLSELSGEAEGKGGG